MGKPKKGGDQGLGASIMRKRQREHAAAAAGLSPLHVADTFVENNNPLDSRTDVNDLEEFMAAAVMSDRNFMAEKEQNMVILPTTSIAASRAAADGAHDDGSGAASEVAISSKGNLEALIALESRLSPGQLAARQSHAGSVVVPRRPAWTSETTPEELDMQEKAAFLEWRRNLASLEENKDLLLTPFEKNIEVWRMLWRVVERSQIVTQIVDARNPLLFRCLDLEAYVSDSGKDNLLLVNKADLLTDPQKAAWAKYFNENDIQYIFFSAKVEMERQEAAATAAVAAQGSSSGDSHAVSVQSLGVATTSAMSVKAAKRRERKAAKALADAQKAAEYQAKLLPPHVVAAAAKKAAAGKKGAAAGGKDADDKVEAAAAAVAAAAAATSAQEELEEETAEEEELRQMFKKAENPYKAFPPTHVYSATELRALLESLGHANVGMVGYPNVGKSSTINCLFGAKKTSVGATPGKTKHFQTLMLTSKLCLCDCPGLVFPTFVATKAELVVNGILPIDQLRDHRGPMTLVAERIPRESLETKYGITFPALAAHEDQTRPPTAEELAGGYGLVRGFMTQRGTPDEARASRVILKDYINGRLLWAQPPPGTSVEDVDKWIGSTDAGNKPVLEKHRGPAGELELDSVKLASTQTRTSVPVGATSGRRAFAQNKKEARKIKRESRGVNPYANSGLEAGSAMNRQETVQAHVQGRANIQSQIGRNAVGGFARVNHNRRGGLS